jgi:hypothetical protein
MLYYFIEVIYVVKQVNKEKVSVTLDLDVFQAVTDEAEKEVRSFSSMLNKILKEWMKEKEGK